MLAVALAWDALGVVGFDGLVPDRVGAALRRAPIGAVPTVCDTRAMPGSVVGREAEQAAVDSLLADAREGLQLLALEGEPGIGKTTARLSSGSAESRLSFTGLLIFWRRSNRRRAGPAAARSGSCARRRRVARHPRTIGTAVVSLLRTLSAASPVLFGAR